MLGKTGKMQGLTPQGVKVGPDLLDLHYHLSTKLVTDRTPSAWRRGEVFWRAGAR